MKLTILDRDLAERMIADLRELADHTPADCGAKLCIHFTLDRIADQFANALAELRRVEPVVDAAERWRATPPVNDSNSTATWARNYTALERAVDAMNAGVPTDEDSVEAERVRGALLGAIREEKLRKRVAELEATVRIGEAEAERQRRVILQSMEDWASLREDNAALRTEAEQAVRAVEALESIGEQCKAQRDWLRAFICAVPDAALGSDKVYRDEWPELFTLDDGNAMYMDDAKQRLLAKVKP